jgi:hypothetical protein
LHILTVIIYLAILPIFDEFIPIRFDGADGCLLELPDFILKLNDAFSSMVIFDRVDSIEALIKELIANRNHRCKLRIRLLSVRVD